MKAQSIRPIPSMTILPINITNRIRPTRVHEIPQILNALSFNLFFLALFIFLMEFFSYPETDRIEKKCENEKRNTGSKNCFMFQ